MIAHLAGAALVIVAFLAYVWGFVQIERGTGRGWIAIGLIIALACLALLVYG